MDNDSTHTVTVTQEILEAKPRKFLIGQLGYCPHRDENWRVCKRFSGVTGLWKRLLLKMGPRVYTFQNVISM